MEAEFDPNGPGNPDAYFGLPYTLNEADLVLIPVPWDVTVSYEEGTSQGPEAIKAASAQVDLSLLGIKHAWKTKMAGEPISEGWVDKNRLLRDKAKTHIHNLETGQPVDKKSLEDINKECKALCEDLETRSLNYLQEVSWWPALEASTVLHWV